MPAVSEKGKAAVARLYAKKPAASLDEFIAVARKADPSIEEPKDRRSFNAKYVLPLKRSAAAKRRPKTAKAAAAKKTTKKRGPGRPRKKKVAKKAAKRGPGRPPKKRGPGRPKKKVTKKVAKRGPGRPPKKRGPGRPRKETTAKRGPGRPRKETTAKRGPGRPRKRPGITAAKFASIKQMIVSREHELMGAAGDHSKAYQLATEIDGFIEKLVKKVTG